VTRGHKHTNKFCGGRWEFSVEIGAEKVLEEMFRRLRPLSFALRRRSPPKTCFPTLRAPEQVFGGASGAIAEIAPNLMRKGRRKRARTQLRVASPLSFALASRLSEFPSKYWGSVGRNRG